MIKKVEQMQKEIRQQMRGGSGEVEILHVFSSAELKGQCRLLARVTLQPGASIGLHEHLDEEEVFYIISGRARINDAGEIREVAAGDAVLTGDGSSHAVEAVGDAPLVMMAVILTY